MDNRAEKYESERHDQNKPEGENTEKSGSPSTESKGRAQSPDIGFALNRMKDMIVSPADTWTQVKAESHGIKELYMHYAVILAAIPSLSSFIGSVLFLGAGFFSALVLAVASYALSLGIFYLGAMIIEFLAPRFDGGASREDSFKFVMYSATPGMAAGIFNLLPFLGVVNMLIFLAASVYGIYVAYLGVSPVCRVPEAKQGFFLVCAIAAYLIAAFLLSTLVIGSLMAMGLLGQMA